MPDDILFNKATTIERCVARAREEYDRGPATFATDCTLDVQNGRVLPR